MLPVSEKDGVTPIRPRTRFMQVIYPCSLQSLLTPTIIIILLLLSAIYPHSTVSKSECLTHHWVAYVPVDMIEVFPIMRRRNVMYS